MDDEKIAAFLDGELDEAQMRDAEAALAADAGAGVRLGLLRLADGLLRRAVSPMSSGADEALSRRLLSGEMVPNAPNAAALRHVLALAAACAFGVWLGGFLAGRSAPLAEIHNLDPHMVEAIETVPSGESRRVAGKTVTLAQTVQTDAGYCRELRVSDESDIADLLVCRDDAEWRVAVVLPVRDEGAAYRLAGAELRAVDAMLESRGNPALVDEQEEHGLIARHWRRPAQSR